MANSYTQVVRIQLVREGSIRGRAPITSAYAAKSLAEEFFADLGTDREVFAVAVLDTKHRPMKIERMTQGTLNASLVHPREVFKLAIHLGGAAILVMHNHPSGDPTPSREDFQVTQQLIKAGQLLGIPVLDHIVVGDDVDRDSVSMATDYRHEAGF